MKIGYLKVIEEIIKGNELRLGVDQLSPERAKDEYIRFKYYREDIKTIVAMKKSESTGRQEVEIDIPLLKIDELGEAWKDFSLLYLTLISSILYHKHTSGHESSPKFVNRVTGETVKFRGYTYGQERNLVYYEYLGDKKNLGILISDPLDFIVNFKHLDETRRD